MSEQHSLAAHHHNLSNIFEGQINNLKTISFNALHISRAEATLLLKMCFNLLLSFYKTICNAIFIVSLPHLLSIDTSLVLCRLNMKVM